MSFIQNILNRFIPVVKADDEELIDHQKGLREQCGRQNKCVDVQKLLTTCNDRVNSRTQTEETCLEELIDYVQCVDHCVAEHLFSLLK